MEIKDLQGKLVAVLGYGLEGKAVVRYLIKHGIKPVLFDQKPLEKWEKEDQEEVKSLGINFIMGPDAFTELKGFDVAFRSPGIKISEIERSVPIYRQIGTPINGHATPKDLILTSQTKWFFEHCPAKIIGVTGTKGKGTTSSLIYEMLKESEVFLTGNIGKEQPLDFLDKLSKDYWVIYELSSFQLQDLTQSPHIAVVLMVTQEHLDYHVDENEYWAAKEAITKYQNEKDFAIINEDYKPSVKIGSLGQGRKLYFSKKGQAGTGCFVKNGEIIIADSDFRLSVSELQLKGEHNQENVCAAVLAAHCAGADAQSIKRAARHFKGLEHRLEFAAEKSGIKFYNDSFSTTPETAIAAIKSFNEPLILIIGGSSKNSDFSELAKTISEAKNIKALLLIGEETDKICAALAHWQKFNGTLMTGAKNMHDIFWQIKFHAKAGDVVLFSPACASFGMFKNYKDRGEQFKKAALEFN
jgi:UDP-N-acetylmuramoylalanine--D-glutamate ligase